MKNALKQILLVGQQDIVTQLVSQKLNSIGYAVTCATSEAVALSQAQQQHFDLYIVDEQQVGEGLECCKSFRSFDAQTPVLLFAEELSKDSFFTALRSGAQWVLKKPLNSYDLIATTARLISDGGHHAAREF